jgi:hypothetical protein
MSKDEKVDVVVRLRGISETATGFMDSEVFYDFCELSVLEVGVNSRRLG